MQYKKAKDKEKFLRGNESSIIIHEAAAKTLQAARNGGKLKKKVKQYDTIKQNVDSILRQAKQPERARQIMVAKNKAKGD